MSRTRTFTRISRQLFTWKLRPRLSRSTRYGRCVELGQPRLATFFGLATEFGRFLVPLLGIRPIRFCLQQPSRIAPQPIPFALVPFPFTQARLSVVLWLSVCHPSFSVSRRFLLFRSSIGLCLLLPFGRLSYPLFHVVCVRLPDGPQRRRNRIDTRSSELRDDSMIGALGEC
jgi:hypothetical protein